MIDFFFCFSQKQMKIFEERGCKIIQLTELNDVEKEELVQKHLNYYSKKLNALHLARILKSPQTNNPFFLRFFLGTQLYCAVHISLEFFKQMNYV